MVTNAEAAHLEALCRLLVDSGDMTPYAANLILRVLKDPHAANTSRRND